jgi:hypothetical protein
MKFIAVIITLVSASAHAQLDTSMYRNYQGGNGLNSLNQGIVQGAAIANENKRLQIEQERLELERQALSAQTKRSHSGKTKVQDTVADEVPNAGDYQSYEDYYGALTRYNMNKILAPALDDIRNAVLHQMEKRIETLTQQLNKCANNNAATKKAKEE